MKTSLNNKHNSHSEILTETVEGLFSGILATIPMTITMSKLFQKLPKSEKSPLPPQKITMKLAKEVGMKNHLNENEKYWATLIGHYSYGAAMGALLSPIARKFKLLNPRGGILFGLLVWSGSYLGLLPALNLHRSAKHEPTNRNALMIVAHIVWGLAFIRALAATRPIVKHAP
jgi:uncharacterized membrane protein YagU involved in acid resistance